MYISREKWKEVFSHYSSLHRYIIFVWIKSIPNQFTSFSYLTFDLIPTVEYNALKQNKKTKSISLYFVSIIPEKSFKSLLMSETLMYPGESDVILIRSIFVDYIVANVRQRSAYSIGSAVCYQSL